MADKPIIFSAPMVRAILAGRKTQTRRCCFKDTAHGPKPSTVARYYAPGDRLWVRERAWIPDGREHVTYHADHGDDAVLKWRPAHLMPRWASRITLEVTDVRVQRLCEISHDDAVAEGVGIYPHSMSAQKRFREIWEDIHGPGSWEANPWVVAVTFQPVCNASGVAP